MASPEAIIPPSVTTWIDRAIAYVKTESHRVLAYAVTEAVTVFGLAHASATTLEHEIAVAGAAAIAALINKIRGSIKL